jgi:hypothetical protein
MADGAKTTRSSMAVDGVRMDRARRCWCGRAPKVSTRYDGMEPGMGPFILKCDHGEAPVDTGYGVKMPPRLIFCRSWSKTRAVANWNRLIRERVASSAKSEAA